MFFGLAMILLWLICDGTCAVINGSSFQHTVLRRQVSTTRDLTVRNPPSSSHAVTDLTNCFNECHHSIQCSSVFFDEDSSNCSMFSGTSEVDGFEDYQQYFTVVNKTFPADFIDRANRLCSGNNSGYVFDAAVPICYKIDTIPRTKTEAVDFCQESGGHLLRIKTDKKQKIVEDLTLEETGSIQKYRIDGEKIDEEWKFSNGERITQLHWYPGQPMGHNAIALRVEHRRKWDDIKTNNNHGCICEKDIE
ncbi:uncharacterized protein LOC125656437 [Ostrea edulis]|uniref:uncharacterized protein LOC125656437 n=1 Tax=Ostrea edulis TaxID=37623 RepID=UPI0024AF8F9E|nr:uncharacterized protein LOC125656437 [Ostrea edulis]